MSKLQRLLKRYVQAEIAEHTKGGKMPEDWPEIEKELRLAGLKLWEHLETIKSLAWESVQRKIENGDPDNPSKELVALRKELRP